MTRTEWGVNLNLCHLQGPQYNQMSGTKEGWGRSRFHSPWVISEALIFHGIFGDHFLDFCPHTAVIECPLSLDGWSQRGQRVKIYYHSTKKSPLPPNPQYVASGCHKKTGEGYFYPSQLEGGSRGLGDRGCPAGINSQSPFGF